MPTDFAPVPVWPGLLFFLVLDAHPVAFADHILNGLWSLMAAAEALKFFAWAYTKGDKMAEDLDYVPMPKKVVSEIEKVEGLQTRWECKK